PWSFALCLSRQPCTAKRDRLKEGIAEPTYSIDRHHCGEDDTRHTLYSRRSCGPTTVVLKLHSWHYSSSSSRQGECDMICYCNRLGTVAVLTAILTGRVLAEPPMTDAEIKQVLQDRIDRARRSVGIVVGIVDDKGSRIISYGKTRLDGGQLVDGDTI